MPFQGGKNLCGLRLRLPTVIYGSAAPCLCGNWRCGALITRAVVALIRLVTYLSASETPNSRIQDSGRQGLASLHSGACSALLRPFPCAGPLIESRIGPRVVPTPPASDKRSKSLMTLPGTLTERRVPWPLDSMCCLCCLRSLRLICHGQLRSVDRQVGLLSPCACSIPKSSSARESNSCSNP